MKELKKTIMRIFFGIEVAVFVGVYLFGSQGVKMLLSMQQEIGSFEKELVDLRAEVATLESDICAWRDHPFYQEKVAREKLQMARAGDMVFYINS